jgi:hypothetical protein
LAKKSFGKFTSTGKILTNELTEGSTKKDVTLRTIDRFSGKLVLESYNPIKLNKNDIML